MLRFVSVRSSTVTLSRTQALKAVDLCLQNALSFIEDARFSISNKKLDHLPIPIQFAMEEIAKSKIILDKVKSSQSSITVTENDGLYDHIAKLKVAVAMLDLPQTQQIRLSLVFGEDEPFDYFLNPLVKAIVDREAKTLKQKASRGHNMRVSSSFVAFDPSTGEPQLGHNMREDDLRLWIDAVSELLEKVKNERTAIT